MKGKTKASKRNLTMVVKRRKRRTLHEITAMISMGGDADKGKKRAQRGEL